MRAVADDCIEAAGELSYRPMSHRLRRQRWICVDFIDVVLHVFSDEARLFYDLDNLWADAKTVEWKP